MAKQAATRATRTTASRKKSAPAPTMSAVSAPAMSAVSAQREPTHQEIAEHAYGLYLARGAREGDAFGDWVTAERTLRARLVA